MCKVMNDYDSMEIHSNRLFIIVWLKSVKIKIQNDYSSVLELK